MKTQSIQTRSGMNRAIKGIVTALGIVATGTAFGAGTLGEVPISIAKAELSSTKGFSANSKTKLIVASPRYTYQLSGKVLGDTGTAFGKLTGTGGMTIEQFLEFVKLGSSSRLHGTYDNTGGTLASTINIINENITGKKTIPGVGRFTIGVKITGTIDPSGKCTLNVSKLSFKPKLTAAQQKSLGNIMFKNGSKLVVTAAPEVAFLLPTKTNNEATGPLVVQVTRLKNFKGIITVDYATQNGTADTTDDYQESHGTLTFGDGVKSQNITVPLINNLVKDGPRTFTITLSNPSTGAYVGTHPSVLITIGDND